MCVRENGWQTVPNGDQTRYLYSTENLPQQFYDEETDSCRDVTQCPFGYPVETNATPTSDVICSTSFTCPANPDGIQKIIESAKENDFDVSQDEECNVSLEKGDARCVVFEDNGRTFHNVLAKMMMIRVTVSG